MIQIGNIPLSIDAGMDELRKKAAKALGVRPGTLGELTVVRQSIDARNKSEVHYVYTVETVPTLSAEDNILLPLYLAKADIREGREYMLDLAKRIGITHLLDRMPDSLSGGERQRVAIARALIHRPKIIMMDEPTGSLDSKSTKEVLELISEINKGMGVSIIQVTHSQQAAEYADRIIRIIDGEVVTS